MTDKNQKKQDVQKGGINPLAAGAIGAAIGVAIGIAAVESSDKKNRDKVKEVLINAKDQAKDFVEKII